MSWLEVLGCECSLLSLQVKFQVPWSLQKFHHCLRQKSVFHSWWLSCPHTHTFIAASHCLQLSLIILQCLSPFFLSSHFFWILFLFVCFFTSSLPVLVYLYIWPWLITSGKQAEDVLYELKGSGQYLACWIFLHLSKGSWKHCVNDRSVGSWFGWLYLHSSLINNPRGILGSFSPSFLSEFPRVCCLQVHEMKTLCGVLGASTTGCKIPQ